MSSTTYEGIRDQVIEALDAARNQVTTLDAYVQALKGAEAEVARLEGLLAVLNEQPDPAKVKASKPIVLQIPFRNAIWDMDGDITAKRVSEYMACSLTWAAEQLRAAEQAGHVKMVGKAGRTSIFQSTRSLHAPLHGDAEPAVGHTPVAPPALLPDSVA